MELVTRRFVRPEHLNHHESLYAGSIAEWVTEASFIAMAKILGRSDGYVLAAIKEMVVTKSLYSGNILELWYEVKKIGTTSVEISIEGRDCLTQHTQCKGTVVYVTVDETGHATPHGLQSINK